MKRFHLRVLAADRPFFEGECVSLRVQLSDGQYGVLADHVPAVAAIVPGVMRYSLPDGSTETVFASEGILKIENNDVLVLATTVERPEEIDETRALRSAEAAREELLRKLTAQEYKEAEARLSRAIGRLKAKGRSLDLN
ncbi:MAG: ATP synthase F1 subunit epsilon [Clostridia bacterium]|nr:ATP synthase F1 subunit epsilon [Clostridia bacterium]MBR5768717.1 ATP synthase F1 subunit epsilon [Clostridia bacterium]